MTKAIFPESEPTEHPTEIRTNAGTFIDWLSFTIPQNDKSWTYLKAILGDGEPGDPFRNYRESLRYPSGAVAAWNPTSRIYVVLSASALFCLEWDPANLVAGAMGNGAKFTRIDIARDDVSGILNLETIVSALRDWNVQTRWQSWSRIESHSRTGNSGQTIYVGNRASGGFLRIYDKAAQTGTDGHWIRVELELKQDKAVAMAKLIARHDLEFSNVLYDHIRFLEPCTGNRRRWPDSPWWTDFLETCERCRLELPKYEIGLEDVQNWFSNTCTSALYLLRETGQDLDQLMAEGKKRFSKNRRHQKVLKMSEKGRNRLEKLTHKKKEIYKWRHGPLDPYDTGKKPFKKSGGLRAFTRATRPDSWAGQRRTFFVTLRT